MRTLVLVLLLAARVWAAPALVYPPGGAGAFVSRATDLNCALPDTDGQTWYNTTTDQPMMCINGVPTNLAALGAPGGGITSLNGLNVTPQFFAIGTAGSDVTVSSVGSTHTFHLPDASATARGVVTTGPQTLAGDKTFTGALSVGGALTASGPVTAPSVVGPLSGNATTASAAAADPANCPAGLVAAGVDASWAAEGCIEPALSNDPRLPTLEQREALVGTHGTPSVTNPYVTDGDPRLGGSGGGGGASTGVAVPVGSLPTGPIDGQVQFIRDGQDDADCSVGGAAPAVASVHACTWDAVLGLWRATPTRVSLQTAYETSSVGGWTDVPASRPLRFAPDGILGVQERKYRQGGDLVEDCVHGATLERCHPRDVLIYKDREFRIRAEMGLPATWLTLETYRNVGGATIERLDRGPFASRPVASYAGQTYTVIDCLTSACTAGGGTLYAIVGTQMWTGAAWVMTSAPATPSPWQLDWSAAGAIVDGTTCTKATTPVVLNGGPSVLPITCLLAAGTIEVSFETPARYLGGALTMCFTVTDDVDVDSVVDLAVIAQFRPAGAVVNSTWSTPAEARVTLATADAMYFACASVTPNGAAAGIGRLFVKATVDNAGGHTDTNARYLGGYITGP